MEQEPQFLDARAMDLPHRRSLAMSLIGHGVVLMAVFLGAAFVHKRQLQYMQFEIVSAGGPAGKGGPSAPAAVAPPAPREPEQEQEAPPPKPERQEFPTQKKKAEKPRIVKKTPPPKQVKKQAPEKPRIKVSRKVVTRSTGKTPAKPAASSSSQGESPAEIRKRMLERMRDANASGSGGGDGDSNAGGSANRWAGYLGPLQEDLHASWEQPSSAENGLKAVVQFRIERDGRLTAARIATPSGNAQMDQSALLAVKTLGIYQPWPEGFTASDAEIEVEFVCKPN